MTATQINPETGKREPSSGAEPFEPPTLAKTQIGDDGLRADPKQIAKTAEQAGQQLAEEQPYRGGLERPGAWNGTQIDPKDGVRKPVDQIEGAATEPAPDQASIEQVEQFAGRVAPAGATRFGKGDLPTTSEPPAEPSRFASATAQGTAPMAESATPQSRDPYTVAGDEPAAEAEGDAVGDNDPRTVDELQALAREYDIEGRSSMSKAELSAAVTDADPRSVKELKAAAKTAGVKGYTGMNKAELIIALAGGDSSSSTSAGGGSTGGDDTAGVAPTTQEGAANPDDAKVTAEDLAGSGQAASSGGDVGDATQPTGSPAMSDQPGDNAPGVEDARDDGPTFDGGQGPAPTQGTPPTEDVDPTVDKDGGPSGAPVAAEDLANGRDNASS